jgi:hypothetical protein
MPRDNNSEAMNKALQEAFEISSIPDCIMPLQPARDLWSDIMTITDLEAYMEQEDVDKLIQLLPAINKAWVARELGQPARSFATTGKRS